MKNNPLFDAEFLKHLDNYRNRTVYVRILSLTTDGYPIEQIEGVATGGTITIDGSSAVRRICSLTMTTKNLNINNIYWGLNARVKIEVGLERKFDVTLDNFSDEFEILVKKYEDYPDVIWFPQGVFLITEFKTNSQANSYTITLTGKDKMCLLNGDIGGVFNAETDIGTELYWDDNIKRYVKEKKTLQYVIQEMIHHYAKEDYGNIIVNLYPGYDILLNRSGETIYIIEDKDEQPVDVRNAKDSGPSGYYWSGSHAIIDFSNMKSTFIYRFSADEDNNTLISGLVHATPTTIEDEEGNKYTVRRILDKDDLGYQIHELDFPDDLIAGPGDTITSILDKIINRFPAYEYFYNLYGLFVFLPKDTYVNTSWNNEITYENEKFIMPMAISKKVKYSFEGNLIITAFLNNPKLNEIKNDFTVWGQRTLPSGILQPIHMRYAIDLKPKYYVSFRKNAEDKLILYITKDYYASSLDHAISFHKLTWLEKKTPPPEYLLNALYYSYESYLNNRQNDLLLITYTPEELNARWWDIVEWAEYYKEIFGNYPDERLMNYGITGAIFSCVFPDGSMINASVKGNRKGAVMQYIPNGISTNKMSMSSIFIFDTYTETGNPFFKEMKRGVWNPFLHGFNGCYHYYFEFLNRAQGNDKMGTGVTEPKYVTSWIYNPLIPKEKLNEEETKFNKLENNYDIRIVDWREIIYQMALDYYAFNHDDNFHMDLFHNNDLREYTIEQVYNIDGRTGYEQYYHDLEGFWRTLYIPCYEKERYFAPFRKLTGMLHELPASITWVNNNNGFEYDATKKDMTIHVDSLSEDKVEFYIDEFGDIRNLDTDNLLIDSSCPNGYTLDILVNRDLAIKTEKEHINLVEKELDLLWEQYRELINTNNSININTDILDLTTQIKSAYGYAELLSVSTNTLYPTFYFEKPEIWLNSDDGYFSIIYNLSNIPIEEKKLYRFRTMNKDDKIVITNVLYRSDAPEPIILTGQLLYPLPEYILTNNIDLLYVELRVTDMQQYISMQELSNIIQMPLNNERTTLCKEIERRIANLLENDGYGFYKIQITNTDANKDRLLALKTQINQLTVELNTAYDAILQAQLALCPYSLFYNCEVNEEDFYADILYTPNGYPIYTDYSSEELSVVGEYNKNIVYNPQELLFWFDFYDANSLGLGQFSVPAIGARPKVLRNESIKALIYLDVPDFIFVKAEEYEKDPENSAYYDYKVIPLHDGDFYKSAIENGDIRVSTRSITAQEAIDDMLYKDSYSNEEVQLTSIPVYHLEPNSIISARDELQLVNGYYILTKMVIPLTYNGTMKNTCVRVPERIY